MITYKITLAGHGGLNKEIASTELGIGVWTDALNVRFLNGSIQQIYGYSTIASITETPYSVALKNNIACLGTTNKIFSVNLLNQSVTQLFSTTNNTNYWTSMIWQGFYIFNNGLDLPQVWSGSGNFQALPNFPSTVRCKSLRNWNNILIALNLTKSETKYPYTFMWSHPADPGTVPPSWSINNPIYESGEADISFGYDEIVDGLQLKNSFLIYRKNSIWRLDYIGAPYIWNLSEVAQNFGVLAPNCVSNVMGEFHAVFGTNDIYICDGKKITSLLTRRLKNWLYTQQIGDESFDDCFTMHNPRFNEVWFCYPEASSSYPNKAVIWNYIEDTVYIRTLPNLMCGCVGDLSYFSLIWNADNEPWASDITIWDKSAAYNFEQGIIGADKDGNIYFFDNTTTVNNEIMSSYFEKSNIYFIDENNKNLTEYIKLVKAVRPKIVGLDGQRVIIKVGTQEKIDGEITWRAEMPYVIGSTFQCDCLVAGRIFAIRVENDNAFFYRLDALDIDVEIVGKW